MFHINVHNLQQNLCQKILFFNSRKGNISETNINFTKFQDAHHQISWD